MGLVSLADIDLNTNKPLDELLPLSKLSHLSVHCLSGASVPFPGWQMRLERKKQNGPAVPLVMVDNRGDTFMSIDLVLALEISGQWPSSDDEGMDIKQLLGEKEQYLRKTLYFIAKQAPGQDNKGNSLTACSPGKLLRIELSG